MFALGQPIVDVFGMNTEFDSVLKIVKLEKFDKESVVCSFVVDESCVNLNGSLHGGYSALLIDVVSTFAFIAHDLSKAGVSVDLNSTYLATCQIGDEIKVVAKVLKMGKTLGFSTVDIIRAKDQVVVCTGRHTKSFPPPRQPKPAAAAAAAEGEPKPTVEKSKAPRPPKL
ncbi:hypothetical protein BASA81_002973 [Batrachochytrium salamandrivorans]|nr:hypothetical protein BASA81_002973 [Batrachochytrium salamandrivorans]